MSAQAEAMENRIMARVEDKTKVLHHRIDEERDERRSMLRDIRNATVEIASFKTSVEAELSHRPTEPKVSEMVQNGVRAQVCICRGESTGVTHLKDSGTDTERRRQTPKDVMANILGNAFIRWAGGGGAIVALWEALKHII